MCDKSDCFRAQNSQTLALQYPIAVFLSPSPICSHTEMQLFISLWQSAVGISMPAWCCQVSFICMQMWMTKRIKPWNLSVYEVLPAWNLQGSPDQRAIWAWWIRVSGLFLWMWIQRVTFFIIAVSHQVKAIYIPFPHQPAAAWGAEKSSWQNVRFLWKFHADFSYVKQIVFQPHSLCSQ